MNQSIPPFPNEYQELRRDNIVAVDPSGNFENGKGHTGIASAVLYDWDHVHVKDVSAKKYNTCHEYWKAVYNAILDEHPSIVVIEKYVVRNNGFTIGKSPETAMLIGMLQYALEEIGIPVIFQSPSQAKTRFKDNVLLKLFKGITYDEVPKRYKVNGKVCNDHERDAMRHLAYYMNYGS